MYIYIVVSISLFVYVYVIIYLTICFIVYSFMYLRIRSSMMITWFGGWAFSKQKKTLSTWRANIKHEPQAWIHERKSLTETKR